MLAEYKNITQNLTKLYCEMKVVTVTKLTWDKYVFLGYRAYSLVAM